MIAFLLIVSMMLGAPRSLEAQARDIKISNDADLLMVLRGAKRGDSIVIAPGTYKGDIFVEKLQGVIIRSEDPARPAVIQGGKRGLQLVAPVDVTLRSLVFSGQLQGGITIDDGGPENKRARGITIEGVRVQNIVEKGNHDGIKLAGVEDVLIRNVVVENWGTEGSAIDFVGVHRALIENALLRHPGLAVAGSGIRVKGGSKSIVMRANRVELPIGRGRALQAGGKTDEAFFRFVPGDKSYEANDVVMEGNVVVGGASALSWVNIDGGAALNNLIVRPGSWVIRILNENPSTHYIATQKGIFHDNRVVFNDTASEFNTAVNIGDETRAQTFSFARNFWINLANPTPDGSRPKLPAVELDGTYGGSRAPNADHAQVWTFPWGHWVINATTSQATIDPSFLKGARVAAGTAFARFSPHSTTPLIGEWNLIAPGAKLVLEPMSQAILIKSMR